jgi:Flp pilus assembly protein TadB
VVSKERARRRAEREAVAQLEAARAARRARWNVLTRLRRARPAVAPAPARPARQDTALGRERARENGVLLAALVAVNAVYWLLQPAWPWRLGAIAATALAWPVLVVVLFDRRSSR